MAKAGGGGGRGGGGGGRRGGAATLYGAGGTSKHSLSPRGSEMRDGILASIDRAGIDVSTPAGQARALRFISNSIAKRTKTSRVLGKTFAGTMYKRIFGTGAQYSKEPQFSLTPAQFRGAMDSLASYWDRNG